MFRRKKTGRRRINVFRREIISIVSLWSNGVVTTNARLLWNAETEIHKLAVLSPRRY